MGNILCSIIIPYYNVSTEYVNRCLNSILYQNWEDNHYEVIFINDGSQMPIHDSTKEIFKRFPKFTLIEQENQGPGIARNNGIIAAEGEYLFFLDSDDYWFPETLHFLFPYIEKDQYDVIKFSTQGFDPLSKFPTFELPTGCDYMAKHNIIKGVWSYCYKTRFLREYKIIMPNIRNAEDDIFLYHVFYHAKKCLFSNINLYFYDRQREQSLTKQKNGSDWSKRFNYYLQGLNELSIFKENENRKNLTLLQKKALSKAFYTIIIDFIYNLFNSSLNNRNKNDFLSKLHQITPIKPLPRLNLGLKYNIYRICSYNYQLLLTLSKAINIIYKLQGKIY